MEKLHFNLKKLLEAIEKEVNRKPVKPIALKKVKNYLLGIEKPKKETLDRISLFVGFQDWDSFKHAMSGEADASINYSEEEKKKE